jgi:hypothetical protein
MKSIFEKNIREALIERINLLHEDSDALWGKMTVTQMVRHCIVFIVNEDIHDLEMEKRKLYYNSTSNAIANTFNSNPL